MPEPWALRQASRSGSLEAEPASPCTVGTAPTRRPQRTPRTGAEPALTRALPTYPMDAIRCSARTHDRLPNTLTALCARSTCKRLGSMAQHDEAWRCMNIGSMERITTICTTMNLPLGRTLNTITRVPIVAHAEGCRIEAFRTPEQVNRFAHLAYMRWSGSYGGACWGLHWALMYS